MKRGRLFFSLTLLVALNAAPTFADDVAQQLESIVVDTFDDANQRVWNEGQIEQKEDRQWVVVGSKFATKEGSVQYPRLAYVESWPDALFGTNPNKLPLKSLGVQAKYDRKGFNYYEIYPVKKDASGNLAPYGMPLPGIAKTIDLWVWGSNFRTSLEIHVRDYRGIPFVLDAGSLNFAGWKNIRVEIPSSIPQTQVYLPHYQGLKLTKFVVRTEPTERVDVFFTYIDHLKVLTDMHQNPFDGKPMQDSSFIDKYWSTNQTQGK
ncbi:MAG: flagellar filament outer layer protein FlaA [Spirochaetales bacterium]